MKHTAVRHRPAYGRSTAIRPSLVGSVLVLSVCLMACSPRPPLHKAAGQGQLDRIDALLNQGADINQEAPVHGTPLQVAAREGRDRAVVLLLERGADPERGQSPLIAAAAAGRVSTVHLLLERGLDPDHIAEEDGDRSYNALYFAVNGGHLAIVELLLDYGADPDAGQPVYTPLWIAQNRGDQAMARRLLEAGTDPRKGWEPLSQDADAFDQGMRRWQGSPPPPLTTFLRDMNQLLLASVTSAQWRQLADLVKRWSQQSATLFDQRAFQAYHNVFQRLAENDKMLSTADEVLATLQAAQEQRKPAYQGYDHHFQALAQVLAAYARGRARQEPDPPMQAGWHFAAGQAQYAASQSGAGHFARVLEILGQDDDDPRAATSRQRLERIELLDRGHASRQGEGGH